eukprot:11632887-Ditylum_brightwellii.AAC.1
MANEPQLSVVHKLNLNTRSIGKARTASVHKRCLRQWRILLYYSKASPRARSSFWRRNPCRNLLRTLRR